MKYHLSNRFQALILIFVLGLLFISGQSCTNPVNATDAEVIPQSVQNITTDDVPLSTILENSIASGVTPLANSFPSVLSSPDEFSWKGGFTDIIVTGEDFTPKTLIEIEISGQRYPADYVDSNTFSLAGVPIPENQTSAVNTEPITVHLDGKNLGVLGSIQVNIKQPALELYKTVPNKLPEYQAGDPINYEITVINTGDCDLTNINITDSLDPSWSYTIPHLPEGSYDTRTFLYMIKASDSGTTVVNRAECSSFETGKTVVSAEESIQVKAEAATEAPTTPSTKPPVSQGPSGIIVKNPKKETEPTPSIEEESTPDPENTQPAESESDESTEAESSKAQTTEESSEFLISEIPKTGGFPVLIAVYLFTAAIASSVFLIFCKKQK